MILCPVMSWGKPCEIISMEYFTTWIYLSSVTKPSCSYAITSPDSLRTKMSTVNVCIGWVFLTEMIIRS